MNNAAPSLHEREAERLAALAGYGILDTPREAAFDDLATLASDICETPIAVVNLIAEGRQWFKAEVGLGVRETPLEASFCAHAILQADYLEVPDATQDPRFHRNPLVTGDPGLRFYAGALLKGADGLPVGTLCVLDTKPKRLSEWQAGTLRRLARQVVSQLELRRALRARTRAEERLRFLDRLAESTQPLFDPIEIMAVTARLLGEHLGVAVCAYADMEPDQDGFTIRGDWAAPGAASIVGTYSLAGFGETAVRELRAGRPFVTRDTLAELGPEQAGLFLQLGLRSTVCMPLVRDGRLTALMAVHGADPRPWSDDELFLIADTTQRSWAHIERTRSEAGLREREERLRLVVEGAGDYAIMTTDLRGRITSWSAGAQATFGFRAEEIAGRPADLLFTPEDREAGAPEHERETARRDGSAPDVRWHQRKNGSRVFVNGSARLLRDHEGREIGFLKIARDETERQRADEALRASEARFEAIANSIDQMIWSTLPDGHHDYYNQRWYDYTGVPPGSTDGEGWNGVFHPDDQERAWAVWRHSLETGEPYQIEYRLRHRSGRYRWVIGRAQCVCDEAGRIARWYGTCTDIQEIVEARDALARSREELEHLIDERTAQLMETQDQLRQAQKMEAVGQLTGGVAHDFNNLLQIVTGNLEILQRNLPADAPRLRRAAESAQTGAKRAAILTQRLLAFSRRQPLAPKAVNVNTLVSGMSELLHRTLGETVELETVLASGLWRTEADPNQLENAILNLAVNARDAMPEGGKLTVETANAHLDRGYTARNAEVQPGQYVVICVSDTGVGMDEETAARVFEPFFTTKEVGKGTGLGLSQVYGFVKQSGGHVKIYSEPGHGTTVKIYLPRLLGAAEEEAEAAEALVPEGAREETILVCEDDDDVRAYSVEVLRELGYRVLEAHDGPSALCLLERQEGRVDLLFSDVVLPGGMTGADLAAEARRLRPGLPVLFTTGYARDAIVHHGRLHSGVELITKPFAFADLAARVRDVLDANGG